MDDREILTRVNALVSEEHQLERRAISERAPVDRDRLAQIEVMLDQCWDLLRQRHARRVAGLDPDSAQMRDAGTVEGYQQ